MTTNLEKVIIVQVGYIMKFNSFSSLRLYNKKSSYQSSGKKKEIIPYLYKPWNLFFAGIQSKSKYESWRDDIPIYTYTRVVDRLWFSATYTK